MVKTNYGVVYGNYGVYWNLNINHRWNWFSNSGV